MSESVKLTKKQKKALEFRSRASLDPLELKKVKEAKTLEKQEVLDKKRLAEEGEADGVVKKKRKTRRGKKGKGLAAQLGGTGPRFILFVGNLPFDISQQELMAHFKTSNPDRIRVRQDKGIAFLEFYNIHQDIQKKIDIALKQHHSILRERKINVELTVGGGGNSETRLAKLKDKNEKLLEERRKRIQEDERKLASKLLPSSADAGVPETLVNGFHPSRARLLG